jgi:hypothetical protein
MKTATYIVHYSTDTPWLLQRLHSGRSGASQILCKLLFSICMINYIYIYINIYIYTHTHTHKAVQTPAHWYLSAITWLPRHMCYHPAVFFHHHLTVLSFPQRQIKCMFQKCYYFSLSTFLTIVYVWNCVTLNCIHWGVSVKALSSFPDIFTEWKKYTFMPLCLYQHAF